LRLYEKARHIGGSTLAGTSKTAARALGQKQEIDPNQRLASARACVRCSKKIETMGDFFPVKVMGKGMLAYCKQCKDSLYK
jgi:hypothetical protein